MISINNKYQSSAYKLIYKKKYFQNLFLTHKIIIL